MLVLTYPKVHSVLTIPSTSAVPGLPGYWPSARWGSGQNGTRPVLAPSVPSLQAVFLTGRSLHQFLVSPRQAAAG